MNQKQLDKAKQKYEQESIPVELAWIALVVIILICLFADNL